MQLPQSARRLYTSLLPHSIRRRLEVAISGNYPRVYDRRKFIFVHIPKTAGKSVCRMIGVNGACHLTYAQYEELLADRIAEYFVFTVVRNPMDRLLSAWSYMRQGGNQSAEDLEFQRRWITPYRSFDDFVVGALSEPDVFGIGKFRPQTDFLLDTKGNREERIQICRFESLQEDLLSLPAKVLLESELPHVNASRRDKIVPSDATKQRVAKLYRADFEILGYSTE